MEGPTARWRVHANRYLCFAVGFLSCISLCAPESSDGSRRESDRLHLGCAGWLFPAEIPGTRSSGYSSSYQVFSDPCMYPCRVHGAGAVDGNQYLRATRGCGAHLGGQERTNSVAMCFSALPPGRSFRSHLCPLIRCTLEDQEGQFAF